MSLVAYHMLGASLFAMPPSSHPAAKPVAQMMKVDDPEANGPQVAEHWSPKLLRRAFIMSCAPFCSPSSSCNAQGVTSLKFAITGLEFIHQPNIEVEKARIVGGSVYKFFETFVPQAGKIFVLSYFSKQTLYHFDKLALTAATWSSAPFQKDDLQNQHNDILLKVWADLRKMKNDLAFLSRERTHLSSTNVQEYLGSLLRSMDHWIADFKQDLDAFRQLQENLSVLSRDLGVAENTIQQELFQEWGTCIASGSFAFGWSFPPLL